MIWLSGLWRLIGGGDQVATNVCLAVIADIFSEEERYVDLTLVTMSLCLTGVQIKCSLPSAILCAPRRSPGHSTQRLYDDI